MAGFLESRRDAAKDPTIIWFEEGPNSRAPLLFIDQPVNSGFSKENQRVKGTDAAAKDIYPVLTTFFDNFPEYAKQDVYITGSSRSGHYVPATANEILSHNTRNINLKGAVIGNEFTDSLALCPSYQDMACGKGGVAAVLAKKQCQDMQSAVPSCEKKTQACYTSNDSGICSKASDESEAAFFNPVGEKGLNFYNLREPCVGNSTNFCSNTVEPITKWLNQAKVTDTLGIPKGRV
ncbi:carboxypeptidase C [Conoideocrella luteorostrata]|uniref:carboxypeptidase C n=1 Tax=Conoideocrella luteorostrata TaxID=1105319 RepID=A0AAJ0FQL9_9HYPO|nr:carboxypeptidase C [Conoideocrella luteorostrata]